MEPVAFEEGTQGGGHSAEDLAARSMRLVTRNAWQPTEETFIVVRRMTYVYFIND